MRRHRSLVDVLVGAFVIALVAVPAATAAPPRRFSPAVLAGTWTGTWHNQTLDTSGTLTLTIGAGGSALRFTTAIAGSTFGCTAPGRRTFGMFTAKQFNATARIALPDGDSATTVVSLAKK